MGICNAKPTKHDASLEGIRARKHCQPFMRGMKAALEGRYTESELHFHKVIFQHPKFLLHTKILVVLDEIMRRAPSAAGASASGVATNQETEQSKKDSTAQEASTTRHEKDNVGGKSKFVASLNPIPKMRGANATITETTGGDTIVEFPCSVSDDLECLLYFLQVQQDIEHVYIACDTPRAHQLAMVYAQFNCIWMQLCVFFLAQLRMERAGSVERQGDPEQRGCDRSPNSDNIVSNWAKLFSPTSRQGEGAVDYQETVDAFLELNEELCRYFLISSVTNYGTLALNYARNIEAMLSSSGSSSSVAGECNDDPRAAEKNLQRKRQRIYDNVLDLCKMLVDMVGDSAEDHPDDYISRVLFKVLPSWTLQRGRYSRGYSLDAAYIRGKKSFPSPTTVTENSNCSNATGPQPPPNGNFFHHRRSTTLGSPTSDTDLSNQSDNIHLLSRMTKLFVAYAEGRGGGTFLSVSRTFSPLSPVALPLRTINLPFRLVLPKDELVTKGDLLQVGGPHCRVSWESTVWTLPSTARFSGHGFPLTSDFLLCNALPEFYEGRLLDAFAHDRGDAVAYTPTAVWRGSGPPPQLRSNAATDAYIDSVLRYADQQHHRNASEAASGTYGGMSKVQNTNMDMCNARMRRAACMDETVTCMKLVYILQARLLRDAGRTDESRASAIAALQQTECLRGPTSRDALRMRQMLTDMGLL